MSQDGKVVIGIEADDSGFKETVNDVESEAKNAAGGMDDLGDSARDAGDGLGVAEVAAGNFISNALSNLISSLGNAVASFLELSDSTREYREDMAKLETAFNDTGVSTDAASETYEDFYAILGESDRSVEAVNHLAELTDNEKDLSKWSKIAAGVTAKFGDSLPIEGLTEAANETAKVGEVTGPLADALNWAGISEDEFNEKLAACADEQERAALITDTLNKEYEAAADEYNELTASTQAARRATSEMEKTQADIGAALEPVTTAWTNLKANALEAMLPVIENVTGLFQKLSQWADENPAKMEIVKAALLGLAVALGTLAIALSIGPIINAVTTAFALLNTTLLANPIFLIVAAVAGLVAAFIYLWNNCDAFREFWVGLWEGIKELFAGVVEWLGGAATSISNFFVGAWNQISAVWSTVTGFFSGIWEAIKGVFATVGVWFGNIFTGAKTAITIAWSTVGGYFSNVWNTIKGIFAVVKAVLHGDFSAAWTAIKGVVNGWAGYFSGVWSNIKTVFLTVGTFFSGIFQIAKSKITNVWDTVSGYFSDVYDDIKGAFDNIFDDFMDIGSNIIDGIWEGLNAGWDWLTGLVSDLAGSLFDAAAEALGIASPSKRFMYAGEMSAAGLGVGWEDELPAVESQMQKDLSGLTARVQATVGAENARAGQSITANDSGYYDLVRAVGTQTAGINSLAGEYRRGGSNMRPVILQLNGRELGRAVVDVGGAEETRVGARLALGVT